MGSGKGGAAFCAPRGGSIGLGDENIGGGGIGPISVTAIGGSGRSCIPAPLAPVFLADDVPPVDDDSVEVAFALAGGDRLDVGCVDPTVMLVVVVLDVMAVEDVKVEPDDLAVGVVTCVVDPDDDDDMVTEMSGTVAARPGNLDMTDGEPEPTTKRQ